MKIASSDIGMGANYSKNSLTYESERLEQWIGSRDPQERRDDKVQLSKKYKELSVDKREDDLESLDPQLKKIILALEILTGKKIKIALFRPEEQNSSQPQASQKAGWGIDYSYEKTEVSSQKLQFASQGNVVLEDGRKIDFKLSFSMQQSSVKHESVSFKAGDALIDPLVIQFQDGAVEFSNTKTSLDLDRDGKDEEFSFVGSGSGFLTLDKNSDGIVNDGSELFGPNSGDGFTDLRQYDSDNNNWIDENDAVFDKLSIWTKDENGNENFYSLQDVGIGALYLQNITTPFEFDEGNLAKSSIFLRENGSAGVISEVDLKV
ncbi:hypothetical protein [Sulfurimonas marina]|uniref:VCBS repeat-containing protein n=1 Tax=Sulfurimonas marina TaxID=2590551 RepID=A0A7M3V9J4_9BACT|nr:hypothetical protein [Sulfurimonas marina]QOP40427.1 hypothetical protein FJR03_01175 [Sulfurimonas marina]